MEKTSIVIVKTGSAVPEARADGRDFEHWFAEALGPGRFAFETVDVEGRQTLPRIGQARSFDAVVVTGSPAMVSDRLDWSERAAGWLADVHAAGTPILGVCYGHQLLAHALGGRVGPNPRGRRMGRVTVETVEADDPLMQPFAPRTAFHVTHLETVLEPPSGARVVATAEHDSFHALYFGGNSWGVQFHPEIDARLMTAYLRARSKLLRGEGHDPEQLIEQIIDDTRGGEFLHRFGDRVLAMRRNEVA